MAGLEMGWIRAHAAKLDRHLRHEILATYRPLRMLPCFVSRLLIPWRMRRRVPVIIQLRRECEVTECRNFAQALTTADASSAVVLEVIRGVATEVSIQRLATLVNDPRVARITYDRQVRAFLDSAAPAVHAPAAWESGFTGEGVTVAVVDTGLYPHPDFTQPENRIAAFHDVVGGRRAPYDDNGHGTHVAGIVAGNGLRSGGRYRGIAPGARLVGVKVLDAYGSGALSNVIRGLDWCVRHKERFNIRVVNLSLGAPAVESYKTDPLAQAVEAVWESGIVVCVAAGNDGPEPGTIATPGIHPKVITVGATDSRGEAGFPRHEVAPFSSRGPTIDQIVKPDLVAPGVAITAAAARKSVLSLQHGGKRVDYITLSGTSMATPICSGIAALLLEKEPSLDPDTVKRRLVESARSLGLEPTIQGSGLVDAGRALSLPGVFS